ncbi:hypothetical protein SNOG_05084 [Parastagonospora nodorum SN15]|uniref:Uncharacterized protein n=1 Tax=Phaeosphaeria nodorum (strain SN15 / ATCC MYA-4574 / FGSC 10173) TaxID=321614 RepID=Q0UT30_PHANO|nr:hypothetical protein SNOG_05084 [Parastagonospora nodorum SN15]EAT87475.2 hypothetical protein SNOG_05084 [Parastagonospora nodorum SN15]
MEKAGSILHNNGERMYFDYLDGKQSRPFVEVCFKYRSLAKKKFVDENLQAGVNPPEADIRIKKELIEEDVQVKEEPVDENMHGRPERAEHDIRVKKVPVEEDAHIYKAPADDGLRSAEEEADTLDVIPRRSTRIAEGRK